jgi:prophage regulatory protein
MLVENSPSLIAPAFVSCAPDGDYLIGIKEVTKLCGLSRASLYRRVEQRQFPQPIKIGALTRWSRNEIVSWIEKLLRDRPKIRSAA